MSDSGHSTHKFETPLRDYIEKITQLEKLLNESPKNTTNTDVNGNTQVLNYTEAIATLNSTLSEVIFI